MASRKDIPADAAELLPTLLCTHAAAHYSVDRITIRRWAKRLGVQCRPQTLDDYRLRGRPRNTGLPLEKRCTVCREVLPASSFSVYNRPTGKHLQSSCKPCKRLAQNARNARKQAAAPMPDEQRFPTRFRPPVRLEHDEPWARELYLQALRAFDAARSPVTEADYA